MNLFGVLGISGSALTAERIRAEVVAANMANAETTRGVDGTPYRRQHVVFRATSGENTSFASHLLANTSAPRGEGVQVAAVAADGGAPLRRYDPGHPDADKDGYVSYPDISPLTEMVDLMGATRAYGLNASAVQATKGMIVSSLEILK
jgi:flagellar basal-body rod protein FlgC